MLMDSQPLWSHRDVPEKSTKDSISSTHMIVAQCMHDYIERIGDPIIILYIASYENCINDPKW